MSHRAEDDAAEKVEEDNYDNSIFLYEGIREAIEPKLNDARYKKLLIKLGNLATVYGKHPEFVAFIDKLHSKSDPFEGIQTNKELVQAFTKLVREQPTASDSKSRSGARAPSAMLHFPDGTSMRIRRPRSRSHSRGGNKKSHRKRSHRKSRRH